MRFAYGPQWCSGIIAESVVLAAWGVYRDWFVSRSLVATVSGFLGPLSLHAKQTVEILQRVLGRVELLDSGGERVRVA